MQQISDYELELMKAIWENGQTALYAEIVQALSNKGMKWTKNTIITLLSRLIDKGLLTTSKIGHRNRYTAIVSADEYQSFQTENFLNRVYEGNAKGLVSTLIQKDLLSPADYEDLKKYWQNLPFSQSQGVPNSDITEDFDVNFDAKMNEADTSDHISDYAADDNRKQTNTLLSENTSRTLPR